MLDELRRSRDFDRLGTLAELVSRYRPNDLRVRRLLAQSLTEQGKASVAADVAAAALRRAEASADPEQDELSGILGRACKQIFMDDPTAIDADGLSEGARQAIERSVAAYKQPWDRDKSKNSWHGVNLAAMAHVAEARNIALAEPLDKVAIAGDVLKSLVATPVTERDSWWHASKAEAHIARGEWADAETAINAYVSDDDVSAFNFASTLRQFRDVWEIQNAGDEGLGLIQLLEATYLDRESSAEADEKPALVMSPAHLRSVRSAPLPDDAQLERVLGEAKTQTLRWYRTGLDRAASVAAVRMKLGKRIGTGFAIAAADLGLDGDELLLLTNFHVVNIEGASIGAKPDEVEIVFEAEDPGLARVYSVQEVVAQSPRKGGLDFALLRVDRAMKGIEGVPLTSKLPPAESKEDVYVIGHAGGHELQFSIKDNWIVDHEGPPDGTPPRPERRRVHYFAPTERGSSGSPVFDKNWNCIALHHAGGKHDPPPDDSGMRKLNGESGYYSANEGIYIESIREAISKTVGTT